LATRATSLAERLTDRLKNLGELPRETGGP
jgi:hypothetical protein